VADVSVHRFVETLIAPMKFNQTFGWPPDVFAVTSALLRRSGAYRHVVSPPAGAAWPPSVSGHTTKEWTRTARALATEWLSALEGPRKIKLPLQIQRWKDDIVAEWDNVTVERLAELDGDGASLWPFVEALLALHAVADVACTGFGTPTASGNHWVVHFLADHLLSTCGTLTRVARSRGIVLPKMRTPQTGLTLRAMSHYVTWHETEVEAIWRATPWINPEENTLNVLVLPWPLQVEPRSFRANHHPSGMRTIGASRYFSYDPVQEGQGTPIRGADVVRALRACASTVSRIHAVVLPELALSHEELLEVKEALRENPGSEGVPLLITGVRSWPTTGNDTVTDEEGCACNCVVLSMFFADKWYDLRQGKHHRWRLNRRQVRQYNIGGVLASDRDWWEHLHVTRRRLSILAPTAWLALCPLICEDLAQLEPVSELIRGVGPTLLVALLLDGPQLTDRWSARYASVMADDPGSSVLTVTPLGMASRSKRASDGKSGSRTIGLWRDGETGFRELEIGDGDVGLVLTLAAEWRTEYSIDGRGDNNAAAAFVLSGTHPVRFTNESEQKPPDSRRERAPYKAHPRDLYELTTFTQVVDAAIDAPPHLATEMLRLARGEEGALEKMLSDETRSVLTDLHEGRKRTAPKPSATSSDGAKGDRSEDPFMHVVHYFQAFLSLFAPHGAAQGGDAAGEAQPASEDKVARWVAMIENAGKRLEGLGDSPRPADNTPGHDLEDRVRRRDEFVALHSILWAIFNRLVDLRRSGKLDLRGAACQKRIEALIAAGAEHFRAIQS
jgi:hypothetical protein